MPRKPRMFGASVPCHVIQRGNNRSTCFFEPENYLFYLECLALSCQKYHVDLHAYVLMTNHVHLLMTPRDENGVSAVMQSVGRRYVQYINKALCRSGTLFEGRFKASLVQADSYFIACMRYIELNPVRANMVNHPQDYLWSSYHVNAGLKPRKLLSPHPSYLALGKDIPSVEVHYRSLFSLELEQSTVHTISNAAKFNMPFGDNRFKYEIELALGRNIGFDKRGRPSKTRVRGNSK